MYGSVVTKYEPVASRDDPIALIQVFELYRRLHMSL